jgi:predicted nucleic acid-binding protein
VHLFARFLIKKYQELVLSKAKLSEREYNHLFERLLSYVHPIQDEAIDSFMEQATTIMSDIDCKDVAFLAATLSIKNAVLWSDDRHFDKQNRIKVLKTKEMVRLVFDT